MSRSRDKVDAAMSTSFGAETRQSVQKKGSASGLYSGRRVEDGRAMDVRISRDG